MGRVVPFLVLMMVLAGCSPEKEPVPVDPGDGVAAPVVPEPEIVEPETIVISNPLGGIRRSGSHPVSGFVSVPETLWTAALGSPTLSAPLPHRDAVVAATVAGDVVAIDRSTGEIRWRTDVGEAVAVSPVAAGDLVYIADVQGQIHALDAADGAPVWSQWVPGVVSVAPGVTSARFFVLTSSELAVLDRNTGAFLMRFDVKDGSGFSVDGGALFASESTGAVLSFDLQTGTQTWRVDLPLQLRTGPIPLNDALILGAAGGSIFVLDRDTGETRQEIDSKVDILPGGLTVGAGVFVAGTGGALASIDLATGNVRWEFAGPSALEAAPAATETVLYVAGFGGILTALGRSDGSAKFAVDLGFSIAAAPVPTTDGLLLATNRAQVILLGPSGQSQDEPVDAVGNAGDVVAIAVDQELSRRVPQSRDLLILSPSRDGTYQIALPLQSAVEMVIDLYDSDGLEIASNLDKVSLSASLTHSLSAREEYLLEVYPVREDLAGQEYSIIVTLLRAE